MFFTTFCATLVSCAFFNAAHAAQSTGCGKEIVPGMTQGGLGQSNRVNFTTSDGTQRSFLLHIPTSYDTGTATPLLFSFHGRSETGAMQEQLSNFSDESLNPNMLVVYPDGINQEWEGDPDSVGVDDIGFVLDMITSFEGQFCIDPARIYSTGLSNGGGLSLNKLACDPVASTKIAAFAGMSGAFYQGDSDTDCNSANVTITCTPGRSNIPIFETHGSADDVIPYSGGPRRDRCLPSIPHFVTNWAQLNGLSSVNTSTSLFDDNVREYIFGTSSGMPGLVTHYWVNGMGHTWPSAANGDYIDASSLVLAFFNNHSLSTVNESSTSVASNSSEAVTLLTAMFLPSSTVANSSAAQSVSIATAVVTTPSTTTPTSTAISTKVSTAASAAASAATSTATSTRTAASTPTSITSSACPGINGTVYTDTHGAEYGLLCAYDSTAPQMMDAVYTSFANCIALCTETEGCENVAYDGACYLKETVGQYVQQSSYVNRVAVRLD